MYRDEIVTVLLPQYTSCNIIGMSIKKAILTLDLEIKKEILQDN